MLLLAKSHLLFPSKRPQIIPDQAHTRSDWETNIYLEEFFKRKAALR